jgi:DHA2 family multidrug resistance protein
MVLFRLLQGAFGAALVPLSQTVLLDAYPPQERGSAMAIWGIGVMLGPIMGPTLGAWLTDNYSWHWVFFINLPIGVFTVLGLVAFMDETERRDDLRFDWFGFLALAVGIGTLQLMLDRGEQVGWFDSSEIVVEAIVSAVGFYFFLAHSLTTSAPFVRFALFKDRNFVGGCLFMALIGVVLFGTLALVTPFLQNVGGYPILTAGVLLAARGVGTLGAMLIVGRVMRFVESRWLVLFGLVIAAATLDQMIDFTNETSPSTIIAVSIGQGFGLGFVFVPLSTVAFTTLPSELRTDGTAILTLVRNVGSSVGISLVIAQLTQETTRMHAHLAEYVNPFNDALSFPDVHAILNTATDAGRAMLEALITQQAAIIAYANDFKLLMYLTVIAIPLVFIIGSARHAPGPAADNHAAID